jgi:hypothetical protein
MATPTLGTTNLTEISTCESTTDFTTFDTLDPDQEKEGSNAITGVFRTDATSGYFDDGTQRTAANKHVRYWINTTNLAYMDTEANGGYELLMYDGTTTEYKTMFGSDTYAGGWFNMVYDCELFTTLTLANVQRWGLRVQHTGNAKNVDNVWIDYIRYLDGIYATGGTSGDEIDLSGIAAQDASTTNGYGIIIEYEGVFIGYGKLQLGNGATTTYFEMEGEVMVFSDQPVASNFYEISGNGSGANITITDSVFQSAGTSSNTRFVFDMSDTNITLSCTNSVFQRGAAITFASGQTVTGNTFNDCGQITHAGADMDNCTVKNYEGTANTSALIYDVNADPDGEMDGVTFIKGTAATHAIEFGTTSPTTMTLRDCTFTSYNASDSQNDSTFHFKRTSGTVTLNLINCTGNVSYRSDGADIVIVQSVTLTVTVRDLLTGSVIENARVFIEAGDDTGDSPFEDSVTITRSASTATVSHTAHGLKTGEMVAIRGANEVEYNESNAVITVNGVDEYTYEVEGTPTSPATGTITSTQVFISKLTNASGVATESFGKNTGTQSYRGWVRYTGGSIKYAHYPISGDDCNIGFNITANMVRDE